MRKNLLIALALLVSGTGNSRADDVFKNITSDKIINPSFEANNSTVSDTDQSDKISSWTFSQNNGRVAVFNSSSADDTYGSSSPSEGNYYVRIRTAGGSSSGEQTLTTASAFSMQKGTYRVSFDYKAGRVHNYAKKFTVSAMNGSTSLGSKQNDISKVTASSSYFSSKEWTTDNFSFSLTETKDVKIKIVCEGSSSSAGRTVLALDNFVLEWNLTQSLKDLIDEANTFLTDEGDSEGTSYTALKTAIDNAEANKTSDNASTLETQYNALATALDLAKNHRKPWLIAKGTAQTAIANTTEYGNVTGEEKTNLQNAIAADEPSDADSYDTAKSDLETKTSTFTDAKASYDGLADARTAGATYTTVLWPCASMAKKTALDDAVGADAPTNAADAVTKTNAIVTAYRQFVESNGLCDGLDNAVDYTSTNLAGADPDVNTGWTDGIGTDWRSIEIYTKGNGQQGGRYYDGGWSTSAAVNINMTRELTLPAGQYQLQITARGSASLTSYTMSIGGESVDLPSEGADVATGTFGHGWSDKYVVFNSDGTTPLTLAITATSTEYQQWISFNRLRLVRLDATLADATDYSNLNSAIAAAEANLGFEEGEYAPYNNTGLFPLLATAKAFDQNVNNAQDDVQAATNALTSFVWSSANATDVNAVYDGTFAAAENNGAPAGWTMSNNTLGGDTHSRAFVGDERLSEFNTSNSAFFLRFDGTNSTRGSLYYYGNTEGYTMPLKSGIYYRLTVDFAGWGSTGKPLRLNISGPDGFDAVYREINTSVQADTEDNDPQRFDIIFYASVAGNYTIYFQTPGSDDNTHMVVVSNIELFKCPAASATMNVKANKWGTFIAPFAVTIPSGVNAYTVTGVDGTTIEKSEAIETTIPANTPVILENTTASTVNEEFNGQDISTADSYTSGLLTGVYTAATIAASVEPGAETEGAYRYVLQTQGSKQAFYKVTSAFTASANRCYLTVPVAATGGGSVKAFFFDGTTEVQSLEDAEVAQGEAYDLTGRQAGKGKLKKGFYIIKGEKVVVK